MVKNSKSEHHLWILHIQISLGTKFLLKLTISFFWIKFAQKGFLLVLNRKSEHKHWILQVQISLGNKFQLKLTSLIFAPNLPKKVFLVENRKNVYHHGILHIWISLRTRFRLKLTILSIWTKFTQKSYFQPLTKQAVQGQLQAFALCVVNANSTVVFEHF